MDIKVIIIGDSAVGKTSLINSYQQNYDKNSKPTVGFNYIQIIIQNRGGEPVTLQIWDTAGQEKYRSIASQFYRGAKVALICFDSNDKSTMGSIYEWAKEIKNIEDECILYLVATKSDLLKSEIDKEEINEFLYNQLNENDTFSKVFLTSAEANSNIKELFEEIANENVQNDPIVVPLPEPNENKKKDCC